MGLNGDGLSPQFSEAPVAVDCVSERYGGASDLYAVGSDSDGVLLWVDETSLSRGHCRDQ